MGIYLEAVLTNRSSKIRISTPIASVQKLCGSFYHIITWGKPQLSSAIPGGGRHPHPPHPQKWPFLSKWPAIDLLKIMKKNEKVLAISPEINATILHTPACTQTWWTEAMGWPIGVRKMRKMCKNSKNWEIWQKIMKKKMKKFSISHLKSMQLYFTHLLVPKNDEPRPWGGP